MKNLAFILFSVALGAAGQILVKVGMRKFGTTSVLSIWSNLPKVFTIPEVLFGFLFFGISSILWLAIISKNEISYAYPMVSLSYVVIFLFSIFLFHEKVSLLRICGLTSICLGVILITRS